MVNKIGMTIIHQVEVTEDCYLRRYMGVPREQLVVEGSITPGDANAVAAAIQDWAADPVAFWMPDAKKLE